MKKCQDTQTMNTRPPDAVAIWQALSGQYCNVNAEGARGGVCVGIVDVLSVCESLAFWHTLFVKSGFSVRVPKHDSSGINSLEAKGRETIPSESVCYPAKLSHIYATDVIEQGANVVFLPKFQRHARCPVSCEYAEALKHGMFESSGALGSRDTSGSRARVGGAAYVRASGEGCDSTNGASGVRMLCPELALRKPIHMLEFDSDAESVRCAINDVVGSEYHISRSEFTCALECAAAAQRTFNDAISAENERALAWAQKPGNHGILLVGRPYHWNRSLLHDVNHILTSLGFSVLTYHPTLSRKKKGETPPELIFLSGHGRADNLGEKDESGGHRDRSGSDDHGDRDDHGDHGGFGGRASEAKANNYSENTRATMKSSGQSKAARTIPREMGNLYDLQEIGSVSHAVPYWRAAKHMTRLSEEAGADPCLDVVCLQSFGCGYDAASVACARDVMRSHKKPFCVLMIDDVVNTSHVRVRLRTLAAAIKQREAATKQRDTAIKQREAATIQRAAIKQQASANNTRDLSCDLQPFAIPLPSQIISAARQEDISAFTNLDNEDYEAARLFTENYCYLVALLVGRSLRICMHCPDLHVLRVPYVCYGCLLDALPATLTQAIKRDVSVVWQRDWRILDESAITESAFIDGCCNDACRTSKDATHSTNASSVKMGILGAPVLVFEPKINDNLIGVIKENGCAPVLPSVKLVLEDDIAFTEQLQRFYAAGVRDVLYLMSFGCLKGHVQVRAKMPLFKTRFPDMRMTIIDFDGDASSLNRLNRALLAISSAKSAKSATSAKSAKSAKDEKTLASL